MSDKYEYVARMLYTRKMTPFQMVTYLREQFSPVIQPYTQKLAGDILRKCLPVFDGEMIDEIAGMISAFMEARKPKPIEGVMDLIVKISEIEYLAECDIARKNACFLAEQFIEAQAAEYINNPSFSVRETLAFLDEGEPVEYCEWTKANQHDGMSLPSCTEGKYLNYGFYFCPFCGKNIRIKEQA